MKVNNLQIAFMGRANVGKSRLINCIFKIELNGFANPSQKAVPDTTGLTRILPNGDHATINTIVIDDYADINLLQKEFSRIDFIILVLDAREELYKIETELVVYFQKNEIPFLVALNKIEFGTNPHLLSELEALDIIYFEISCKENAGLESFRKTLIHMLPNESKV